MSEQRLPGLLGYQIQRFIETDLLGDQLSLDEGRKLQTIIDNWYLGDESKIKDFLNADQLQQLNQLIDHYRYRIIIVHQRLYLLEYHRFLHQLADLINQYHLNGNINNITDYVTQRLGNIKREDLAPLIHLVYKMNADPLPEKIIRYDHLKELRDLFDQMTPMLTTDNERAYEYAVKLYDSLLHLLGQPTNDDDLHKWRILTTDIIDRAEEQVQLSDYAKSYVQQLLKYYDSRTIPIPRPTKDYVIVG